MIAVVPLRAVRRSSVKNVYKINYTSQFIERKLMKIMFINNDGGGFADFINIEEGTTVEQLFKNKMPLEKSTDYLIRVNRQPVP